MAVTAAVVAAPVEALVAKPEVVLQASCPQGCWASQEVVKRMRWDLEKPWLFLEGPNRDVLGGFECLRQDQYRANLSLVVFGALEHAVAWCPYECWD